MESRIMSVVSKTLLMVFAASIVLYSQWAVSASNDWVSSVPVPPQATLEIISENVQHNGLTLTIARLVTADSLETNLDFYRAAWGAAESSGIPGYVEQSFDNWVAISRLENGLNTVVQFDKSTRASESAIVSIMRLDQSSSLSFNSSLHPVYAELLSSTRTSDLGRDSTVEVLKSSMSIDSARRFYKMRFRRDGWNLVSDRSVLESQVLMFNKKLKKAEMYLGRDTDGSTLVVINQVIRDD